MCYDLSEGGWSNNSKVCYIKEFQLFLKTLGSIEGPSAEEGYAVHL